MDSVPHMDAGNSTQSGRKQAPSERVRVRQHAERATYDLDAALAILDAGLVAHVAVVRDDAPMVIPMAYGRIGTTVYLHGGGSSTLLRGMAQGATTCVTVTLLDGLVLARSAFKHSMNYRSVVAVGQARTVTDSDEHLAGLRAVTDHNLPGRWDSLREPTRKEIAATQVLAFALEEFAVKSRSGPPLDAAEDLDQPVWAGEIPLRLSAEPGIAHSSRPDLTGPDLAPTLRADLN